MLSTKCATNPVTLQLGSEHQLRRCGHGTTELHVVLSRLPNYMLMDGGIYKGRHILAEESVKTMTSDQLTREQKAASGFVPGFFEVFGWGFCMSVITGHDPVKSVGTYGWDGGLGTSWFNDPVRSMTAILMTQQSQESPAPPPVYTDFWNSAYAALE